MQLPLFVAKRYFFSRKKKSFISIISVISMLGVAVGVTALVVALSVFNGLEDMIRRLYGTFDPEIKISAAEGKSFEIDSAMLEQLRTAEGVRYVTEVIEDNALMRYRDAHMVVKVKGVSDNFTKQARLDSALVSGQLVLSKADTNYAIVGLGVQYALNIVLDNHFYPLQLWHPKKTRQVGLSPESAFTRMNIRPGGVFSIEQHFDDNYVFVPLSFAEALTSYGNRRTSLEIQTEPGSDLEAVQKRLKALLGDAFLVQNSDEQHASLIRAIRVERLFVFLTFAFILGIASFNIFFSLSMLAIEKKHDVAVFYALGATPGFIRRLFMNEGALIAFTGAAIGLVGGLIFCLLQQHYGIISMGMQTSILDAYPIKIQWEDFVFSALLIIVITLLATYRPASQAASTSLLELQV
ncbi:lipoprotein-releasing system permease protein [Catalinimonas alkaloidigena]|uniref:Lipoprotein-releasing system permease protein n=1 Tax=Catalinimonas alkaloidigena TaxID=1075417 RepID=A0A1G9EP56_9BACT|nr:FtsX-like permease family protein [Catalinimonas alkaloidigena]SDK77910.1 lipoprotein-releasing system permease protein [Catalinimonas alkaloidigena]